MEFLNNIRIRKKLITACVIISVVPVVIISFLLTSKLYKTAYENTIRISRSTLLQLRQNYLAELTAQKNTVDFLAEYAPLRQYIYRDYASNYESFNDYIKNVHPVFQQYTLKGIGSFVKIYSNNSSAKFSSETNNHLSALDKESWFISDEGTDAWTLTDNPGGEHLGRQLCYYRIIRDEYDAATIKMVVADFVSVDKLYALISQEREKIIFLCNDKGEIVTSTSGNTHRNLSQIGSDDGVSLAQIADGSVIKYKATSYVLMTEKFSSTNLGISDWQLYYLVPHQNIVNNFDQMIRYSVGMCFLCLMVSLVGISTISQNITSRLSALAQKINSVSKGNYRSNITITGRDELGQIDRDFDTMTNEVKLLIDEVNATNREIIQQTKRTQLIEVERKEAELKALQAQINPHFLFNTLESIRMNLVLKKDLETAKIMAVFAAGIRAYIGNTSEYSTIEAEIDFIERFITIQKYRFGDKICFAAYCGDAYAALLIPRLVIQPIIENAVFHGIEPKDGTGTVLLEISRDDDRLLIKVTDDGVGIDAQELHEIENALNEGISPENTQDDQATPEGHTRIGIINVHNRIVLMYGESYGIRIKSKRNFGTEVEIALPVAGKSESTADRTSAGEIDLEKIADIKP